MKKLLKSSYNLGSSMRKAFKDPELLNPNVIVNDITDLNFFKMKEIGIQKLIFDKNNTLVEPYYEQIFDAKIKAHYY